MCFDTHRINYPSYFLITLSLLFSSCYLLISNLNTASLLTVPCYDNISAYLVLSKVTIFRKCTVKVFQASLLLRLSKVTCKKSCDVCMLEEQQQNFVAARQSSRVQVFSAQQNTVYLVKPALSNSSKVFDSCLSDEINLDLSSAGHSITGL